MIERELTEPVSLIGSDGRLNPAAVGWARRPLVDTTTIGRRGPGRRWGRAKRWEYWNVMSPGHILAMTVSSLDYAAVHEVWVHDRTTGQSWGRSTTAVPAKGVELPGVLHHGPVQGTARDLQVRVEQVADDRYRLWAEIPDASFDVIVTRPADHDCLAVVVPWSSTRFQYTVKDLALPAEGTVTVEDRTHPIPAGSWAVLDHGRGFWPYRARWNWGAGSGLDDGRVIGVQLGGRWTDDTGVTENGLLVDGHLHKIHDDLRWAFDPTDYLRPWTITGETLRATFAPTHNKITRTNLGVLAGRTDQCFGTWSGQLDTEAGPITFAGIDGWAEDVHNRW